MSGNIFCNKDVLMNNSFYTYKTGPDTNILKINIENGLFIKKVRILFVFALKSHFLAKSIFTLQLLILGNFY